MVDRYSPKPGNYDSELSKHGCCNNEVVVAVPIV